MRIRRWLTALFMALVCTMVCAGAVQAEPLTTETTSSEAAVQVRTIGGKYYLYNTSTMKAVTGRKGVTEYPVGSGNWYYFVSTNGQIRAGRVFKGGAYRYYADADGLLAEGFTTVDDKTYYFNPDTFAAATGWTTIEGSTYHFNRKGVMHTGFVTLNKRTYYLNPADNGARVTGWARIDGKWYYFSKTKGIMQTGIITDPNTKQKYYLNASGIRKTGKIKVNGKYYYFDKTSGKSKDNVFIGGAMATGWQVIKGKTYYFSESSGAAVTGWASISGNTYYFTKNKGVMKKGWFTVNGKRYYFGTDGIMQTGLITYNGSQYYLKDGVMQTSTTVVIDSTKYTFGADGKLVSKEAVVTGAYSIKVNRVTNVVTIYRSSTPVKAMLCSVGLNGKTPTGTFSLSNKKHWQPLFGGVYGQYTSTITGNILFHSVYYYKYKNDYSLNTSAYNKLGSAASAGCVRLSCGDAYYIYTNCPVGTKVTIFDGTSADDPLGKPAASAYSIPWSGSYDPTDPIKGD